MTKQIDNQAGERTQRTVLYIESEQAWRVIDRDGTAFVANYRSKNDALDAAIVLNTDDQLSAIERGQEYPELCAERRALESARE